MSNQLVLYLLVCCVRVLSNNSKDHSDAQCSLQCTTSKLRRGEVYSKCNISDPLKLNCRELLRLHNVSFLDLANNNLNKVPRRIFSYFRNLTILSLANNNIKTIEPGTFTDLRNLSILDLSFNDLRQWRVEHNSELQSLNNLSVTGNEYWVPSEQLLKLKNLATVQGVTWTKNCKNCSLMKIQVHAAEVNSTSECYHWYSSPNKWEWHDQIQYGKALDFIKLGFWPTCLCDNPCLNHQKYIPLSLASLDITLKASFSLYATTTVALLLNITAFLVILFKKSLRGNLSICLILNIVVCDVLISMACLLFQIYNPIKMLIEFYQNTLEKNTYGELIHRVKNIRNIVGPILTCAVISQVFGTFILTLEKFLKVVFAMRPGARIGKRSAAVFLFFFWSVSVTFAVLPVFEVGRMSYNVFVEGTPISGDLALYSDGKWTYPYGIAAGSQITVIAIQFTSFVLYLPIFIVAKRSGANVGIKREAAIAKKIALLVFTNLIFFTVPLLFTNLQTLILEILQFGKYWQDHALAKLQWVMFAFTSLPVLCVSINSVLNPVLYAFKHPKIKQQLQTILSRCRTVLNEYFVALRQHLHCHSGGIQQEIDMEMQETKFSDVFYLSDAEVKKYIS